MTTPIIKRSAAILVLVATPIHADAAWTPAVALRGFGAMSCDDFNHKAGPYRLESEAFSWAQGFLSGRNLYTRMIPKKPKVDLAAMSSDAQTRFLDAYCRTHPKGEYIAGVDALWTELENKTPPLPRNRP